MKLSELDPHWWIDADGRSGMGVAFECPVHRDHYLGVWFANPVDGGPPAPPSAEPLPRWKREGTTFDTLTLAPSVNAAMNCKCGRRRDKGNDRCTASGPEHTPCWHGHIERGEIR